MDKEYTIKAVGKSPKPWSNKYGDFVTYLIQVEGNGEPVQINKKADSAPPKEGDTIYGKIEESEFGQKFKAVKKPFGGYQKDEAGIKAMWAIGQAVSYWNNLMPLTDRIDKQLEDVDFIEKYAKEFFAMVDRVKSEPTNEVTDA